MSLIKRYFDMTDDRGNFLIGYDAAVRVPMLPVRYRALLSSVDEMGRETTGLGQSVAADFPASLTFGGKVTWRAGEMTVAAIALKAGPIDWRVDAIGFDMQADAGASRIAGRGYCETIELAAWPWQLGLTDIRWGRFVGAACSAVWNIGLGANSYALMAVNGRVSRTVEAVEGEVRCEAGEIVLGRRVRTIHEGDQLDGSLKMLAPVIRVMAGRRFALVQHKHVREARVRTVAGDMDEGFAIDETVRMLRN